MKVSSFSAVFTLAGSLFQLSTARTANEYYCGSVLGYCTARLVIFSPIPYFVDTRYRFSSTGYGIYLLLD
jgi:hypothetical protein